MELKFQVQLKIRSRWPRCSTASSTREAERLFRAEGQRAAAEGTTVKWTSPRCRATLDVVVRQVVTNERIVFEWAAAEGGYNTRVEMAFKPLDAQARWCRSASRAGGTTGGGSRRPTATAAAGCT